MFLQSQELTEEKKKDCVLFLYNNMFCVNNKIMISLLLILISMFHHMAVAAKEQSIIKYFLRDMNTSVSGNIALEGTDSLKYLDGLTHYRLVPGDFSYGKYHFDGLATVMKFTFELNDQGSLTATYFAKPFESEAYQVRV